MRESDTRFRLLYELACAFAERIELDDLLPEVIERGRATFDAEGVSVLLLDAERGELYFPYVAEEDPEARARLLGVRMAATLGIAGEVARTGRPARIDDARVDPRFFSGVDAATGTRTGPLLAAPLVHRGTTIGVIEVVRRSTARPFSEADLELLSALAASVAVAIDNARLYASTKASEERLRTRVGALESDLARRDRQHGIVGTSPAMEEVFRLMASASASPIAVLIQGETGTGKELVARAIHRASARGNAAFIAVNCAALPESLLESELFGHRKGSFTGAHQDRRGVFEAASGGTILLDEVGEMPAVMQAKLLRVLQEGEIVPVGDTRPRRIDVRVVSATNRDLAQEVAQGRFRQDLYYRLNAFPIRIPPLRARRADIPLLVEVFLRNAAEGHGKRIEGIDPEALDLLVAHEWSGNVRELQNEIDRAVALAHDEDIIEVAHLSPALTGESVAASHAPGETAPAPAPSPAAGASATAASSDEEVIVPLREARMRFEIDYLRKALAANRGNVSGTARAVGLSRFMVQRKMKEYGLR